MRSHSDPGMRAPNVGSPACRVSPSAARGGARGGGGGRSNENAGLRRRDGVHVRHTTSAIARLTTPTQPRPLPLTATVARLTTTLCHYHGLHSHASVVHLLPRLRYEDKETEAEEKGQQIVVLEKENERLHAGKLDARAPTNLPSTARTRALRTRAYTRTHACTRTRAHAHTRTRAHAHTRTRAHAHAHARTHAYARAHMHIHLYRPPTRAGFAAVELVADEMKLDRKKRGLLYEVSRPYRSIILHPSRARACRLPNRCMLTVAPVPAPTSVPLPAPTDDTDCFRQRAGPQHLTLLSTPHYSLRPRAIGARSGREW